jgi:hypothetical protein
MKQDDSKKRREDDKQRRRDMRRGLCLSAEVSIPLISCRWGVVLPMKMLYECNLHKIISCGHNGRPWQQGKSMLEIERN